MSSPNALAAAIRDLPDYDPDALPVESARRLIAQCIAPVEAIERVAIRSALGRVLAVDLVSPIDVPSADNSAMDGYALRADDLPAEGEASLRVVGDAFAGHPFAGAPLARGEAVRVMTGAVMPAGGDTVVMQEEVHREGDRVRVPTGQRSGQNVRRRGEDLAAGSAALPAGRRVTPADLGLIASLGCTEVSVRRRVRVAFFSTGDELCPVGQPLPAGHVYDSNRYTLYGMLTRLGVDAIDLGVIRDDPRALEDAIRSVADSVDAIISSGGVSVGDADFTREVMSRLGQVEFWGIAMRPGRPLAFGRIGRATYFGLPGNPVAVMTSFYFFVRDALLRTMGATPDALPLLRARVTQDIRKRPGRTEYQRGVLATDTDGNACVRLTGSQGSGMLRSMTEANCILMLHHDQGSVQAGAMVDCVPFEGLI